MPEFGQMQWLQSVWRDVVHLWFPETCQGCRRVLLEGEVSRCLDCEVRLPWTRFEAWPDNPVERLFWGRIPLEGASSMWHLRAGSPLHTMLHALKYEGRQEMGEWMGEQLGQQLTASGRFAGDWVLLPVPIHPRKLRTRGYNQAACIARGMARVTGWALAEVGSKTAFGPSQTGLGRAKRWQNVAGTFGVEDAKALCGKRVLLVDDVLTTGATLEAFGREVLAANPHAMGVATVAYTNR